MYTEVKGTIASWFKNLRELTKIGGAMVILFGVLGFFYSAHQVSEHSDELRVAREAKDHALRDYTDLKVDAANRHIAISERISEQSERTSKQNEKLTLLQADHRVLLERYENMKAFYNRRELNK